MKLIALDTNILIYFFNENPEFVEASRRLLATVQAGQVSAVASVLVISEIMRKGSDELYWALTAIPNLAFVPVDATIALKAAELQRLQPGWRLVDALHVATALVHGAQLFWTNDRQLSVASVPGLDIRSLAAANR